MQRPEAVAPVGLRCLWISRYMPYPLDGGAKVYSAKLAESLAATGATVRFLGFGDTHAVPREANGMQWVGVPHGKRNEIAALFSPLPNAAAIDATSTYKALLEEQLRERWDAIVFDGYGSGWALDRCLMHCAKLRRRRPVLVHVSHNDEESVWFSLSRQAQASLPRRLAFWQNYLKVRALERRVAGNVDLLTTITEEDRQALSARANSVRSMTLTPGYAGQPARERVITADTPRRAIVVGSFFWVMKQENLRRFLDVADPIFQRHGIGLDIVGEVPQTLLEHFSARCRATRFHGFVDDMAGLLSQARVAVVPEMIGGGFKLKFLDYIFARVPVATLTQAAAGLPETLRQHTLAGDDLQELVDAIVAHIDQLEQLNRMQQQALDVAAAMFRWEDRGVQLGQAIVDVQREQFGAARQPTWGLGRVG